MFGLGMQELFLILFVLMLFFGAKKLPQLARGLGQSVSELKKGMNDLQEEVNDDVKKS